MDNINDDEIKQIQKMFESALLTPEVKKAQRKMKMKLIIYASIILILLLGIGFFFGKIS